MISDVSQEVYRRAARVRMLVLDVDGVLTDGSLYLGNDGSEFKVFYARDGHGIKLLQASGVEVAVITGRQSQVVAERMAELGVVRVYQGQDDKLAVFEFLLAETGLDPRETAYVGDDLVDLPVMALCGLAVAVADADSRVAKRAHWQTRNAGGRGAVRDVCELILDAHGDLDAALAPWLGSDRRM